MLSWTDPPIGLGTLGLRGEDGVETLLEALEMGYRHLDSAQGYGTEPLIARAIEKSDVPRSRITVATKVSGSNLAYEDVLETGRASRDRLGVDSIDLLYVHQPKQAFHARETAEGLLELRDDGVIDAIGVSKFNRALLDDFAEATGSYPAANQIEVHPTFQQRETVAHDAACGVETVAFSPLRKGDMDAVPELQPIAERHDATPAQVALAWLVAKDVFPIPKRSI
jgi:2,5-diketo-D-gluconate reductase B